jgi:hypothetical protein
MLGFVMCLVLGAVANYFEWMSLTSDDSMVIGARGDCSGVFCFDIDSSSGRLRGVCRRNSALSDYFVVEPSDPDMFGKLDDWVGRMVSTR